ncbi:predicted protein [Histoplasma capsulatum G186AR]|uniref:Uncharacterized protein n=1 Tax=Ajellomyces capsulatus (strain G186AR / H82 / ATCC MYA-2454 / RMSCC 2432) TaxID=447093 RepID=C0NGN7_AJECG|nr:uncharacterized protein HCBG_02509 [Histoplasma capsulatum G186AR]EEH08972.1 predicted protein [Histoplasma capsulatum G186AR]
MVPGIKVPADSSHGDDGQTPSEYARITRSASKRSVQHREDGLPGEGARGRAWSEEALNELVAKSEWEEYDDVKSLTGEEKELGNRAMIKLDDRCKNLLSDRRGNPQWDDMIQIARAPTHCPEALGRRQITVNMKIAAAII